MLTCFLPPWAYLELAACAEAYLLIELETPVNGAYCNLDEVLRV